VKEEEKEKLHLEQQQHYDVYFTKKKKICEIHYSIITRLIDC